MTASFAEILETRQREFSRHDQQSHNTSRQMWLTSCAERVLQTGPCETRPAGVKVNSRQEFAAERFSSNQIARLVSPKPPIWANILEISCSDLFL